MNKQDYYVYVHRRLDNNEIFYVGSGRGKRCSDSSRPNKQWNQVVDSVGFKYEIVCSNLTKEDSLEIEDLLIQMLDGLVNKSKPIQATDINDLHEFLSSIFYLDDTSKTGLRYKVDRFCGKKNSSLTKKAGDEAGIITFEKNKSASGYSVSVTLDDGSVKVLRVHRIIYLLHYGYIRKDLVIDHIDGNPLNNNISNLKMVTQCENSRNRKSPDSKIHGITLEGNVWRASVYYNGVRKSKSFSINKYGNDEAYRLALDFRKQMLEDLKLKGVEYSTRHTSIMLD